MGRAAEQAPHLGRHISEAPLGSSLDEEDFASFVQAWHARCLAGPCRLLRPTLAQCDVLANTGEACVSPARAPLAVAEASCGPFAQEREGKGASCTYDEIRTMIALRWKLLFATARAQGPDPLEAHEFGAVILGPYQRMICLKDCNNS